MWRFVYQYEAFLKKLQDAGDSVGRLWQLPLWDVYKQDIESDIADVKNYSGKPVAGAISAAKFLEYFTKSTLHGHIWMLPGYFWR
jgi:leucyl aminopeptidase